MVAIADPQLPLPMMQTLSSWSEELWEFAMKESSIGLAILFVLDCGILDLELVVETEGFVVGDTSEATKLGNRIAGKKMNHQQRKCESVLLILLECVRLVSIATREDGCYQLELVVGRC